MKKIISIILLIGWLLLIFSLSNQTGTVSGGNSNGIIYDTLEIIYDIFNISKDNLANIVDIIENPIRELMHSFEYLILTLLFINVLNNFDVKNKIINTILFIFISASFDEIHQLFVEGRSFQYFDIFMDMLGCLFGISLLKIKK